MTTTSIVLAILWTLDGVPMPRVIVPVDLPFGEPTGEPGQACAAAEVAWRNMAMEELMRGTHSSMSMRFKCRERKS